MDRIRGAVLLLVLLSLLVTVDTAFARRWRSMGDGLRPWFSISNICPDGFEFAYASVQYTHDDPGASIPIEDYDPNIVHEFWVPLYLLRNPQLVDQGSIIGPFLDPNAVNNGQFIRQIDIRATVHNNAVSLPGNRFTPLYHVQFINWDIPVNSGFTHFTVITSRPDQVPGIYRIPEDFDECLPPKPPPVPNVRDWNFHGDEPPIRTHVPHHLEDHVFVRPLVTDGNYSNEFGASHAGNIGNPAVLNHTILQAADVFMQEKTASFGDDVVICLTGLGELLFLPDSLLGDATNNPPYHPVTAWMTPHFPSYTCATLYEPGTLVLVEGEEPTIMADP